MDVLTPEYPVLDLWLQTIEALCDTSHVRNYASGEWLTLFNDAGLMIRHVNCDKLSLEFVSWIARMRTPIVLYDTIGGYQKSAADDIKQYYGLQRYGSVSIPTKRTIYFLRFPVFQSSTDILPASDYPGTHEIARCYILSVNAL